MNMFERKGATTVPIGPLDVPAEEINNREKGEEWYTEQRIMMKVDRGNTDHHRHMKSRDNGI
jgi:hypothetical protein